MLQVDASSAAGHSLDRQHRFILVYFFSSNKTTRMPGGGSMRRSQPLIRIVCAAALCALAVAVGDTGVGVGRVPLASGSQPVRLRGGGRGLKQSDFDSLDAAAARETQELEAGDPEAAARWRALQEEWNKKAEALAVNGMLPPDRHAMVVSEDIPIRQDIMDLIHEEPPFSIVRGMLRVSLMMCAPCCIFLVSRASLHSPVMCAAACEPR